MRKIHMIRHGMTEGNRHKRYIGATDEDLCPEGVREILEMAGSERARILRKSPFWVCSPMRRCLQTAWLLTVPEEDGSTRIAAAGKTDGQLLQQAAGQTDGQPLQPEARPDIEQNAESIAARLSAMSLQELQDGLKQRAGRHFCCEEDLRECCFGHFENRNYIEMTGDDEYQAWIDSGGTLPFPDGESIEAFDRRVCEAWLRQVRTWAAAGGDEEGAMTMIVHGGTIMSVMERLFPDEGSSSGRYRWNPGHTQGYTVGYERTGTLEHWINLGRLT